MFTLTGIPIRVTALAWDEEAAADYLRVAKTRAQAAGLPEGICNHTFRGTGITVFLQNGGALEAIQDMANHPDLWV
jgi:site-specific recombinase XerD